MFRTLIVIPARSGSKGVTDKNIRLLGAVAVLKIPLKFNNSAT
ncbi:cytidylyltransferase domain-containing protein [methane-oxidizing endosymbiont of Gigantopelta aegis]|nr:hypothetical protein [methane-oxidizing endosymbiont of Gigantopelta aegis]